ncbi:hypothetical protein [Photobacterium aquae]|nr:hypothetical protein [Photobacterium aquae]
MPAAASPQTATPHWQHSLELYFMGLNIRGDSTIRNRTLDLDVDPKFIMDNLDIGAMARWESIYHQQWGFYLDYSFMELSGETDNLLSSTENLVLKSDIDIRQGVLEAKGFKRYHYPFGTLDYMIGLRWWDNDISAEFFRRDNQRIFDKFSLDENWVDYVVGVRWINAINKHWLFHVSVDAGLGSDTDFTSAIQTGVRYRINHWSDINIAYKSTWVDYDNQDNFAYNTASQGFLLGWTAHF